MAKSKTRAPESTLEEIKFLRSLVDNKKKVRVKMEDNAEVSGFVEFFDSTFIRLTRPGEPNLFIYKHDIKYLFEEPT
jgi:host factor-I protein